MSRITPPSDNDSKDEFDKKSFASWLLLAFLIGVVSIDPPTTSVYGTAVIQTVFWVGLILGFGKYGSRYLKDKGRQQFEPEIGDTVGVETEGEIVGEYHNGYLVNIDGEEIRINTEASDSGREMGETETEVVKETESGWE